MSFLKKLTRLLDDAAVPEAARLRLALGCLRGSAAEWGEYKEEEFKSFDEFLKAFKVRYWDAEAERALFKEIKYGKYATGSRADYFLRLAKLSHFLSPKMSEIELIEHLIEHFSAEPEVKRSIVIQALNTVEQVETFLRKIDTTDIKENNRSYRDNKRNTNHNYDQRKNFNRERERTDNENANANNKDDGRRERIEKRNCNVVEKVYAHKEEDFFSDVENVSLYENLITPVVSGKVRDVDLNILIDSGSHVSAISENCLKLLHGVEIAKLPVANVSVRVAVGAKEQRVTQQILLPIKPDIYDFEIPLLVIPKLKTDLILRCDWLSGHKVQVNFNDNSVRFPYKEREGKIYFYANNKIDKSYSINFLNCENSNDKRHQYAEIDFKKIVDNSEMMHEDDDRQDLLNLLKEFSDVFSETPGRTNKYEHEILLRDNTPFFRRQYPIPFSQRLEVSRQIKSMIENNVIEQGRTEYISPLLVVKKKDGSLRVCLDARYLNARMCKDYVMPPNPEELLNKLGRGKIMSTLDMTAGYWQIPIKEEHRQYTGFIFDNLTYYFKVLPFGLTTAVASFIRGLTAILGSEVENFTIMYVDDLLIVSESPREHLRHLQIIFEKFRSANLTIKLRKSHFAQKEISFLGHIISMKGISMDSNRMSSIQNYPRPRNIRELRGFLGVINYCRRFCDRFSDHILPLVRLLKKSVKWEWGSEEDASFKKIKELFLSVNMVSHPDYSRLFYIECDSSNWALGACLYQLSDTQEKQIIAFTSRILQGSELRYTVSEKELLALVHALKQWRVFILGYPITVLTDHKSLTFLLLTRMKSSRLTRRLLYIQEYDLTIQHIPGSQNILADALSRNPVEVVQKYQPDLATEVNLAMLKLTKDVTL